MVPVWCFQYSGENKNKIIFSSSLLWKTTTYGNILTFLKCVQIKKRTVWFNSSKLRHTIGARACERNGAMRISSPRLQSWSLKADPGRCAQYLFAVNWDLSLLHSNRSALAPKSKFEQYQSKIWAEDKWTSRHFKDTNCIFWDRLTSKALLHYLHCTAQFGTNTYIMPLYSTYHNNLSINSTIFVLF